MVTTSDTHELLHLIDELSLLNNECRNLPNMKPNSRIYVQRIGGVIDTLENIQIKLQSITVKIDKKDKILISIKRWIHKLEKNYSNEEKDTKPFYLSVEDAKMLDKDTNAWSEFIIESFHGGTTYFIKEESINQILNSEIISSLDHIATEDLKDGINVLIHLYPTPAVMILFRVVERILQEFYKQITGSESGKKPWGRMLDELEKTGKVKKSLMGYLYHLNEKRIDSAHPYRRFTQEEAERILLQIKDLIEAIKK